MNIVLKLVLVLVLIYAYLNFRRYRHYPRMHSTYRQAYDGGMGYSGGAQRDPFGSAGSATQPTMPFVNYVDDDLAGH